MNTPDINDAKTFEAVAQANGVPEWLSRVIDEENKAFRTECEKAQQVQ